MARPPLSVIKIVKYGSVGGGGRRQNPTQDYGAPLSVIKMVKYCDVGGGGGGTLGALKPTNIMALPLCHQDS